MSSKELQDAAQAFDQSLPRGDAAWTAAADAALFDALTRDLPSAPTHWLGTIVTDDLCRQLLHDRMRANGDRIGLSTIYRTLRALADAGLVDVVCQAPGIGEHHAFTDVHHIIELSGLCHGSPQ